jgi:DNA-binding SARP family transcriptional activator/DNA-binding GntR family transcriptional regulator
MELRVLGPLEATAGTMPLALGGGKARALLARLVLDVNRTVSVQRLVDDLWGDAVPESAVKMVQIYVSQLRKVLPDPILRTRPPGYMLELEPEAVDVTRFTRMRGEGRAALSAGDPTTASARLRDALSLWRGAALAEFSEPFALIEGAHLEELRIACQEERIDADLALGQHAVVIGELEALVARHPLRESPHRRLMLALYRAGRQAEALAAYERFRRALDDQLGIEPSATLKDLQLAILNQDPGLDLVSVSRAGRPAAGKRGNGAARLPAPAPRRAANRTDFVGRAAELDGLQRALGAAAAGEGNAVLIAGRAGIGKTRLTEELAELARAGGATVLHGRCIQLVGLGLPYLPLADALRPLRGSAALDRLAVELSELPRLVPELGGRLAPAAAAPTRSDSRLRLFEEVLAVLEHLAAAGPLVLVLEDMHWADESTLDLVAFLVHTVRARPILVLATYRSDELRQGNHLHRLVTGLVGGGAATTLILEPLDRDELEAALAARWGRALGPELLAAIALRSQGNPFYACELSAAAARGESALPPALRDVLLATVGRLGADSRSVLRVMAAAGRAVPYGLLAALVPLGELELAEALREAVDHDVLVPEQAAGGFRFRHELFAEAVYGTLLPGEREVLHERLARALSDGAGNAAEIAQHWAAAGRPVEALEASLQAARDAEAVSGLTEALRHVERVLELWDQVPAAERLVGIALPSVLAWAAKLAGMSVPRENAVDARKLVGALPPGQALEVETVAARLGVSVEAAADMLATLEGELVERVADGVFRVAPLGVTEARRLYPTVVVLESLAVRQSPPFGPVALDALRNANERLLAARDEPATAIAADDDFHTALTADCGNEHLIAALQPIRRALLRYERVYMREPARVERSVAQHAAIIAALERGDHAEAAQRLRENLPGGLPDLREALES